LPQQLISALIALFLGGAPAVQPAAAPAVRTSATIARLRVAVSTTSDRAIVRISPGSIVAQRVVSLSSGAQVREAGDGIALTGRAGRTSSAVMLVVYRETTKASRITIAGTRGSRGTTTVTVTNESAKPFRVARVVASSKPKASSTLARGSVFGRADPAMSRADPRKLVLAFYYPWYNDYSQDRLADRPSEPRSTRNPAEVLSMVRQAKTAGIDGLVVSWNGDGGPHARGFDLVLRAAEQTGSLVTAYLETPKAAASPGGAPDRATVKQWLAEAIQKSSSGAFLRSGGVPVVFVYQMRLLEPAVWRGILDELARSGLRVRLVGDGPQNRYAAVEWGLHHYIPVGMTPTAHRERNIREALDLKLLRGPKPADHAYVATVFPGLNKVANPDVKVVARGANGETYAGTWEAALASPAEWVIVTSWNEWFEGTAVEPGVSTGDLALRQTERYASMFKR
jgi:hypothetical protein